MADQITETTTRMLAVGDIICYTSKYIERGHWQWWLKYEDRDKSDVEEDPLRVAVEILDGDRQSVRATLVRKRGNAGSYLRVQIPGEETHFNWQISATRFKILSLSVENIENAENTES